MWYLEMPSSGNVGDYSQEECKKPWAMLQTRIRTKTCKIASASNIFDSFRYLRKQNKVESSAWNTASYNSASRGWPQLLFRWLDFKEHVHYCFGSLIFTACWPSQLCVVFLCTTSQGILLVIGLQLMRVTLCISPIPHLPNCLHQKYQSLYWRYLTAVHTKIISCFIWVTIVCFKHVMKYHILAWQADW